MTTKGPICLVGLGYVGLPLAHAFAKKGHDVIGYDVSAKRIEELSRGFDRTNELTEAELKQAPIRFSTDAAVLSEARVIILAIPTPVDDNNKPDLSMVEDASRTVGKYLKPGTIVVYESTVYPGVTEEICGPILEQESGLTCGKDFTLGYSPERINPGDKTHTVEKIVKIVSGQDEATTDALVALYGSVVEAGIHRAPSIKVAEMAKAIENAQRDLNIAYMNEVAMLCNHLGIATKDVLQAAGTKWNFLKFQPGLVGGHCIGVDPYYLVEKARQLGMDTQLITAGRRVNDGMGPYVAQRVVAALPVKPNAAKVLILGQTFKEDVPDSRNSKVGDVAKALKASGCTVKLHDPFFNADTPDWGTLEEGPYHAILLLVPHKEYLSMPVTAYVSALADGGVFFDLKSLFGATAFEAAKKTYLAL